MLQTKKSQAGTVAVLQDQSVWLVLQSQRDVHSYILKLHFTNYICGNVWRSIKQDKTLKEWNVSFVVLSIWPHCPWAGCPRTVHVDSFLSFLFCLFFSPNTVFQEWPGFFFFFSQHADALWLWVYHSRHHLSFPSLSWMELVWYQFVKTISVRKISNFFVAWRII